MSKRDELALLRSGKLEGATRLDLSYGLTEVPEEVFELADTLEILNLSNNRLTDLPDELARLTKLRILFCSQNDFQHLPPVIGKLPALRMLGFKSNRIGMVGEESLPPSLRWLILTDNRIEQLPASLGKCLPLQKLMLAGNQLAELPEEIAACVNLELVRLAANRFGSLPPWLFELPRLSWLAYSGNPMCGAAPSTTCERIDWADLEAGEKLGEGASGIIHRATWNRTRAEVAVKVFKGAMTSDGLPASEKAACLAAGAHRHLVPVLGEIAGHPAGASGLVMELVGSDFTNLASPPNFESCTRDVYAEGTRFTAPAVIRIALGIAEAAMALHAKGIMHGDLYAHNILWNGDGGCLLGDFGAATFYRDGEPLERIEARAFGCLLEELLERMEGGDRERAVLEDLMRQCLRDEPAARPTFAMIAGVLGDLVKGESMARNAVAAPCPERAT